MLGGLIEPNNNDNMINREKYAVSLRKERKSKMLAQRREDLMKRLATDRWSDSTSES